MSKENFKNFVKNHPELAQNVLNHKSTWQDFYELFELYGESSSVWDPYLLKNSTSLTQTKTSSMVELINMMKKVDLDSVQKTVNNLQKTIGLLQDIGIGGSTKAIERTNSYEPRPMYKYFDD